ncbi:hypothetical protein RB653_003945 [Dictyostelium firmibasis]|uniref:Ribosomal protein/NADH dehydrogenase domain-containing protein n=1 Tax=Dictyostelium firmibasis TaxID=79012 RepID=A0AAN7U020_9MYCE
MQRFYSYLNIAKPKTHTELLKAFSMQKIYLYNAKKITFVTSKSGSGGSGARVFKYKYLEPFQFWNSDLHLEHLKKTKCEPHVIVENLDGTIHNINANSKNSEEILEEVLNATNGKKINVNIPLN